MSYNKHQKLLNITFLTILIVIGIVFVSFAPIIKNLDSQLVMAQGDPTQGYRISSPLSLSEFKNVTETKIEWLESIPDEDNTRIIIETAVTDSSIEEPTTWTKVDSSGDPIPGIEGGDLSGFLWTKQTLENDDPDTFPSPELHSLTETITMRAQGYRTSPEFDISGEWDDMVKETRIFWQANERFEGDIEIKVNVLSEGEWNYEQDIVNGGRIPGLEPGTSLTGAKIQTKASFIEGLEFYPSLENIKIFLELE